MSRRATSSRERRQLAHLQRDRRQLVRYGRLLSAVLALVLSAGVIAPPLAAAREGGAPVRLLVTYAQPVDGQAIAALATAAKPAPTPEGLPPSRVQVLELDGPATAAAVAARLAASPGVLAVEPDHRLHTQAIHAWGVDNTGRTINGRAGARGMDIGIAPLADAYTGDGTVVAVVDGGVDIAHPLLRDRMWHNPGEQRNGRDDDGNGYVDDLHGWDFITGTPRVSHSPQADAHGTHVAGIVAAGAHPATGFQGVAPDARIMALRVFDADGVGYTSGAVAAIRYAADNGADVINLSFSGPERSLALATAIAEAPVPVVVSAGNTGQPHGQQAQYPAQERLPNQLTVAALDHTGAIAGFSATSRSTVHVAAPGRDILSTLPSSQLGVASGTSMAAPFVAGVVALATEAAPQASAEQLVQAVLIGARPASGAAETVTGGIARASGTLAALGVVQPVCAAPDDPGFTDVPGGHTHHYGVACLSATGVTAGISPGFYGAEQGLSRAQVASLVANALSPAEVLPEAPEEGTFSDLGASVHRDNIEVLASIGVVDAAEGDRFDPHATVTRAEFAAIVARAAEYAAGAPARVLVPAGFLDIALSPARADIELAYGLSLVSGRCSEEFAPDADVRRDQAATMLVRLLDRLHQQGLLDAA